MGKLIPLTRLATEPRLEAQCEVSLQERARSRYELWPIGFLLFAFSLARVVHALLRREPFDTEPTIALGCVLGLPVWFGEPPRKLVETRGFARGALLTFSLWVGAPS